MSRGTVNYKGVEMGYQKYSAREYDEYLSDDNAFEEPHDDRARDQAMERAKKEYERRQKNKAQRDANSAGVAANKKAIAAKQAPAPKPKGDQQIDPVKASPGVSAARQVVNSYQSGLSGGKSPWEQANETVNSSAGTSQFTPKQGSDLPDGMAKKDPQAFADKYKLNLINSGATK